MEATKVAAPLALSVAAIILYSAAAAWSAPWRSAARRTGLLNGAALFQSSRRHSALALNAAKEKASVMPLQNGPSEVFTRVVDGYDPEGPHEFAAGSPPTGYRTITEAIRPYHPNPEWMIFPDAGFGRDQKFCSLYTLATGLYKNLNKALREDNEDSIRRHMVVIHNLREVVRFEVSKIGTPEGRKCKPFIGKVLRGLTVPAEEAEALADSYKHGAEFTWPSFTSTQMDEGGLWPFDGNVNFEIECNIDPKTMGVDEVYAPVRISRFLQGSNEVLFPPQTKFRVVGEREPERVKENEETKMVYTKILEVVELPTPYKK